MKNLRKLLIRNYQKHIKKYEEDSNMGKWNKLVGFMAMVMLLAGTAAFAGDSL